jgi:succinyl-diaminopimelate desuccinylase
MKGGISCILQAAAWATTEGLPVKVILGVDEENISQGANDLIRSGKLSDVGFLIVAESGQVTDFSQPISVCLGRKGRIVFEIEVSGMAAHAAEHHKGVNAIEKAAELCLALRELPLPTHPKLGASALVTQGIRSEASAFSVPDHCTITCSLLTCPGMTSEAFMQLVTHTAARIGVQVVVRVKERATPYGEAFEIDQNHPFYQSLYLSTLAPLHVVPMFTPSVADENFFAHSLGIPVLSIGPIGSGDHTKDEWVRLSSLAKVVDVYKRAIALYATNQ